MKKRYYKTITATTFDFIYEDSPVELIDKTDCYDVETFEYFTVIRMKNVSSRQIESVRVGIMLYDNSVIPYKKIEHTYKPSKRDVDGYIGGNDYIPIPQTYYTAITVDVKSVTFSDGEVVEIKPKSEKRVRFIADERNDIVASCEILEENEQIKENFPAIVFPQFSQSAWICCCSHKNPVDSEECIRCTRNRDTLAKAYSNDNIQRIVHSGINGTATVTQRIEKAKFLSKRDEKSVDEKKELLIEEQVKRVEARERYKEKMRIQALPRFALYFAGAGALILLVSWIGGLI